MSFTKKIILLISLVITVALSLLLYYHSSHDGRNISNLLQNFKPLSSYDGQNTINLFQDYKAITQQETVMKGLDLCRTGKSGSTLSNFRADTVATMPMRWRFLNFMDYYQLIFYDAKITIDKSSEQRKEATMEKAFSSMIETVSPPLEKHDVITMSSENFTISRKKTPARIIFSPVNIKMLFSDKRWLSVNASRATLEAGNKILTLTGEVQVNNSSGVYLNSNEALWQYNDGIIETVGPYQYCMGRQDATGVLFSNKKKHPPFARKENIKGVVSREEGRDRQFKLTNDQIEKGVKGPGLALFRPQNPVSAIMNNFSNMAKPQNIFPFQKLLFNQRRNKKRVY